VSAASLRLAHRALEQWLREHLHAFESFERSGAAPLEQLGMDAVGAAQLLLAVGSTLGIALPDAGPPRGVLQTPNTLLAFLSAAAMEHALGAWPQDKGNGPT
jgi:hypothetical protein